MEKKKLTPVMRQYEQAKASHPDAILFFRLGDFYEMFHDDAVLASRILNLTLTSRSKSDAALVPMAGVPHHAAHGYIAKLLDHGYKVALCEQLADPSKVKGIVPREVVRVITPGLVTDADQLEASANHFLAAIDSEHEHGPFGFALLDLSTGELLASALSDSASLLAELCRSEPREVLLPSGLEPLEAALRASIPKAAVRKDESLLDSEARTVLETAGERSLLEDRSSCRDDRPHEVSLGAAEVSLPALRAAARALRFASRCTPGTKLPVQRLGRYEASTCLVLDDVAQSHLELVRGADGSRKGSLLEAIDRTVTSMGARLLRRRLLAPLLDVGQIRRRLDEVELFFVHAPERTAFREVLSEVYDLERLSVRALLSEATPKDLAAIRDTLSAVPRALEILGSIRDPGALELLSPDIDPADDLRGLLAKALVDRPPSHARDGGIVREGYCKVLDEYRRIQKDATELILALETELRAETNATSLRVKYTRVFGWYIEVTKSHLGKVPSSWRRKQTVAGGERYTNDALDDLADKIEHAESHALERETTIFSELVETVAKSADRLRALSHKLAAWDVATGLADVAHRSDYVRPFVDQGDALTIVDGRHPVVERLSALGRFVPNDTDLDLASAPLWLITGPNMAGKSTLMRQVALIVILAQTGSFVPARQATVGIVDRILSRVGASDNVARGESTFMVEMRETATILRHATRRSLVILDEIGRGTSTFDGLAIAWAVAEHLHDMIGCRAMFATHYHELTELSKQAPKIANYSVSAREHGDGIVFLHKLTEGPASRSYGVAVARLAGLPEAVLMRAKAILADLESKGALPTGEGKVKSQRAKPQLDLFGGNEIPTSPLQETLRSLDIDRVTPLEALQVLAKLKLMATSRT